MEHKRNTFSKDERLCSRTSIKDLFTNGTSFFKYPFKVIIKKNTDENELFHRILISVPKRSFKKAVDRNKIKRLIREAYRLNKEIVYPQLEDKQHLLHIAFIYTAKSILPYKEIERKIVLILQTIKIRDEVSAN